MPRIKKVFKSKFNGAFVMSGCQGGVHTKMQENQPAMSFTHCIAHKLELALLDSVKFDKNLEKIQPTLSAMFLCDYYSSKKCRETKRNLKSS